MSTLTPTKAVDKRQNFDWKQIIEKQRIQPAWLFDLTHAKRNKMFPKLTTGSYGNKFDYVDTTCSSSYKHFPKQEGEKEER